jgi:hypothetical protein
MEFIRNWIFNLSEIDGQIDRMKLMHLLIRLLISTEKRIDSVTVLSDDMFKLLMLTGDELGIIKTILPDQVNLPIESIICLIIKEYRQHKKINVDDIKNCVDSLGIRNKHITGYIDNIIYENMVISAKIKIRTNSLFMDTAYSISLMILEEGKSINKHTLVSMKLVDNKDSMFGLYVLGHVKTLTYAKLLECSMFVNSYVKSKMLIKLKIHIQDHDDVNIFVNGIPFSFRTVPIKKKVDYCQHSLCSFINCDRMHEICKCVKNSNQYHISEHHSHDDLSHLKELTVID